MPEFRFKARNSGRELVEGVVTADSAALAAQNLLSRGHTPITIQEVEEQTDVLEQIRYWWAKRSISINDLILFSRQMHGLTKAGVPLISALNSLAESSRNPVFKAGLTDLARKLETGQPLSQAMAQHEALFPMLLVSIVHIGETTGSLEQAFLQIGHYLGREKETQSRIKTALRYPSMVIAAISIAMVVINIYVIPSFKGVFDKLGAELPWQTRALISISNFTVHYWPHMLVVLFLSAIAFMRYLRTPDGHLFWDRMILKIPVVGGIISDAIMERFARSFAMIMQSGVPVIQGISIVANAVGNVHVSERLQRMRLGIEKGDSISRMAKSVGLFPPLVIQMLIVGEESGNIADMLHEAADFYEGEMNASLKNLSSIIEPVLIVVIGAMVLVLALGVFLPMWNLSSAMHN